MKIVMVQSHQIFNQTGLTRIRRSKNQNPRWSVENDIALVDIYVLKIIHYKMRRVP